MKHTRKLASLLLALVMVFTLATTAFAEETTYSITINNSTAGHTYEAYQIFTGDLQEVTTGEGEAATTTKVHKFKYRTSNTRWKWKPICMDRSAKDSSSISKSRTSDNEFYRR